VIEVMWWENYEWYVVMWLLYCECVYQYGNVYFEILWIWM